MDTEPSQELAESEDEEERERRKSNEGNGVGASEPPKKKRKRDDSEEDNNDDAESKDGPPVKKRKLKDICSEKLEKIQSENDGEKNVKDEGKSSKKDEPKDSKAKDDAEDEEEEECCVCLQSYSLPHKLSCGHVFCFLCIKEIINVVAPTCPLCRAVVPTADIENAKMSTEDFEKNQRVFQWEYSGKKGGWWAYEEAAMQQIEEYCVHWVKGKVTAGGPVKPATPAAAVGFVVSDPSQCYEIEVGTRIYLIDFDNMVQYPKGQPHRQRKIRRKAKLQRSGSLKGQAGLFFDDNTKKGDG